MSVLTIISELWRLFKDNIVRILFGAVIIALLASGGRYIIGQYLFSDFQEAKNHLMQVYSQEPASFKVAVTIEDGQILSNPHFYDDYFSSPEVVAQIEAETGIKFNQTLKDELELELFKTPTYRGSIAGIKDSASGMFIFRILAGETAEENLAIAEAYSNLLVDKSMPFADLHNIQLVSPPRIGELIDIESQKNVPTLETLNVYRSTETRPLIIYGIIGFVLGMILMYLLVFCIRLTKKRINYAFEYIWDDHDQHRLYHSGHSNIEYSLQDIIRMPAVPYRWVMVQNSLPEQEFEYNTSESEAIYRTFPRDVDAQQKIYQIVIIVYANHTDKKWYRETLNMARLYKVPIKIIHFIA